jgi:hypothetical protein
MIRVSTYFKKLNVRGNAIIEAVLTLPVLVLLITGFFVSIYLLYAHFCLKYRAYEDTICVATEQTISSCEDNSRKWLNHLLPFGNVTHLSIKRTSDHYAAWIELELLPPIPIISSEPILVRREHWLTRDEAIGRSPRKIF